MAPISLSGWFYKTTMADNSIINSNATVQTGEKLCPIVKGEQPTLAPSSSLPKLHPIDEARQKQQQVDLQSAVRAEPQPFKSLFGNKPVPVTHSPKREPHHFKPQELENKDHFNKHAASFAADPWANPPPKAFNDDDFQREIFKKGKKEQRDYTRKQETMKHMVRDHSLVPQSAHKPFTKTPGTGENRDVSGIWPDDDDCYQPDIESEPPENKHLVQIGDRDDPESEEEGEDFTVPSRILVDKTPFMPFVYTSIVSALFLRSLYKTTIQTVELFGLIRTDWLAFTLASIITVTKYMNNFYWYFQSHYLAPSMNTYLVKQTAQPDTTNTVVRHEKNRLTQQTNKGFATYKYETRIELPTRHWLISLGVTALNYAGRFLTYFNIIKTPKIKIPDEIHAPAWMRNLSHNRFYEVKNGMLRPKKIRVNVDLLQRIMTTKAINYHLPIEQQMKTITALTNNQSDINLSNKEFKTSTVSDTLTLAKFQLLNKTGEIAEMGFEQASLQLQRNMVIDTTQLRPNGGLPCQSNRKPVLPYDPPDILPKGLTVVALFSVTLGLLSLTIACLTRTFPTRLDQFSEKLKDLLSKFPLLNLGRNQSEKVSSIPKQYMVGYDGQIVVNPFKHREPSMLASSFTPLEPIIWLVSTIASISSENVVNFVTSVNGGILNEYHTWGLTEQSMILGAIALVLPLLMINCSEELDIQDTTKMTQRQKLDLIAASHTDLQELEEQTYQNMEDLWDLESPDY